MNFGKVIKRSLQRAELPIDEDHLDLARGYANDNIEDLWYMARSEDRIQKGKNLSIVASTDEYALDKLFDGMVKNSLQGPASDERVLTFLTQEEFARKTAYNLDETGDPRYWTYGELRGFDSQLSSGSVIKVASTLANVTTGTLSVTSGSDEVTASSAIFNRTHIGLRIRVGSDLVTYEIVEYLSTTKVRFESKYRGSTDSAASYKLGDIGQIVTIEGIVSGQVDFETVELDGDTTQTTSKTFTSIRGVSKSAKTGGRVTAKNSAEDETVATLAPRELEIERQTIKVWPIPDASETLTYSQYAKHPTLALDSDRLLFKQRYHRLIQYMTTADLIDWDERTVPTRLEMKIEKGKKQFEDDANDTSQQTIVPSDEGLAGYGDEYYYDHDEDFA